MSRATTGLRLAVPLCRMSALLLCVSLAALASVLGGCGEDGSATHGTDATDAVTASPTPSASPASSAPRYSEADRDLIVFVRSQMTHIDNALAQSDEFVKDAGVAFDEEDLVAFDEAWQQWREAYVELEQAVKAFAELPEGEHARVRKAMRMWARYADEVGGLYRAIGAAVDEYFKRGAETPAFDRVWTELEWQREEAYAAMDACDEVISRLYDAE